MPRPDTRPLALQHVHQCIRREMLYHRVIYPQGVGTSDRRWLPHVEPRVGILRPYGRGHGPAMAFHPGGDCTNGVGWHGGCRQDNLRVGLECQSVGNGSAVSSRQNSAQLPVRNLRWTSRIWSRCWRMSFCRSATSLDFSTSVCCASSVRFSRSLTTCRMRAPVGPVGLPARC